MPKKTRVVADILDKQIVDSKQLKLGKVDGIVLVLRKDKPPRIAAIEVGTGVALRRFAKWTERFNLSRYRIPWSKVKELDINVELDFDACESPPMKVEHWIRDHIVEKVPFG